MKKKLMIFILCFLLLGNSMTVMAGSYQIMQAQAGKEQITVYLEGNTAVKEAACQVGMTACENVEVQAFSESDMTIHTIVLFDNSLSITDANKEKAQNILRLWFEAKQQTEYITLATYGEDIEVLAAKESDTNVLLKTLENIEHQDRDTYLTDVIYDILDTLEENEYTRFVVVSDGVDNKSIGITKEELLSKLGKNTHPIYTIGHVYKENNTQLENLFALSRVTNAESYLLDEVEDVSKIVDKLQNVEKLMCIEAEIPQEVKDGGNRSVLITLTTEEGKFEVKADVTMPFSLKEEPEEVLIEEPEPVTEVEIIEEVIEEVQEIPVEPVEEENGMDIVTTVATVVLIVAVTALVVYRKKDKKDKHKKKQKAELSQVQEKIQMESIPESDEISDADSTIMLECRYMLVLRDQDDAGKVFQYPLDHEVVLGRNADKVNIPIDYNKTVSGQHCVIFVKNSRFYVRDLNSVNGTYMDGHKISQETEICSGCLLALGEVRFNVEIRQLLY